MTFSAWPLKHPAIMLGLFALVTLGFVVTLHERTRDDIVANEQAELFSELAALLPTGSFDNAVLTDLTEVEDARLGPKQPVPVYRLRKAGQPVAVVIAPIAADGYNGSISLLVAIQTDGVLAGVRVIRHRETPGLGDAIEITRSNWIRKMDGRSLEHPPPARWQVRRDGGDFDQLAGATITSRAVITSVRQTLAFYRDNASRLFDRDDNRSDKPEQPQ
jgi:electron transport complex protein RnfG